MDCLPASVVSDLLGSPAVSPQPLPRPRISVVVVKSLVGPTRSAMMRPIPCLHVSPNTQLQPPPLPLVLARKDTGYQCALTWHSKCGSCLFLCKLGHRTATEHGTKASLGPHTKSVRTLHVNAATYSHYSLSLATTQSSIAELLLLFNHNILGCWTTT
jgi:hypothetical protein